MARSFEEILEEAKYKSHRTITVAAAEDELVLAAVEKARTLGIVEAILVGDEKKIRTLATNLSMNLDSYKVVNEPDIRRASYKAVAMVSSGEADMVMKGLVDTASFLRAVLNKETGLRTGRLMSHVGVFEVEGFDRLLFVTDAAFNMYPGLKDKADIIKNAVELAGALGVEMPRVACLSAVEVVNSDMQATLDAAVLAKMGERGQIKGCLIDGPLALDNAISEEAAKHKRIGGQVAGSADILLMPNIESGNMLYKSLTYMARSRNAAILVGTAAPVIVTSRTDSMETKVFSIAMAALAVDKRK